MNRFNNNQLERTLAFETIVSPYKRMARESSRNEILLTDSIIIAQLRIVLGQFKNKMINVLGERPMETIVDKLRKKSSAVAVWSWNNVVGVDFGLVTFDTNTYGFEEAYEALTTNEETAIDHQRYQLVFDERRGPIKMPFGDYRVVARLAVDVTIPEEDLRLYRSLGKIQEYVHTDTNRGVRMVCER